MEIKSFDELIAKVKAAPTIRAAIASAADLHTLEAAVHAHKEGIIEPVFIGDKNKIEELLSSIGLVHERYDIIDEPDILQTSHVASKMVNAGKADIVVKGFIDTSDFLRGILDKEHGLRTGNPMSHIAFLQVPGYKKLLAITDGGMVTAPDYQGKVQLVENAVAILRGMGYECPKVAAVTAVEKPNKAMPETLDAQMLQEENKKGIIKNCIIEGPVSYDIVMSRESAQNKGFTGKHSEDYDILLMPNISAGNIMSKALMYNAGAKMSGLVAGAKVPLVLNSRSSSAEEKFYAIVLAAASRLY